MEKFYSLVSCIRGRVKLEGKSWRLEDAQKIADEFPYTFYKPSQELVSQLKKGNQAKLIFVFESTDPEAPRAERMWVDIEEVSGDVFKGSLDNDPAYIKDLKYKDPISFNSCHIIDTDLNDPVPSIVDKYIKRCFVTNNVLYDGEAVGYLYREDPDHEDDSGWRMNTGKESDEYMEDLNNISYVSLGAVLSQDDSVIHLLDREVGCAFARDEYGQFVELE